MKTIDSLVLFWTFTEGIEKYQEEVDGLVFFGYWVDENESNALLSDENNFISIWGRDSIKIKSRKWQGRNNCQYSIEMLIVEWPNEGRWERNLENSLKWFIENGAVISWCGTELCSPSLSVFDSDSSVGAVYAAYNNRLGLICNSSLSEEFEELSDSQLNMLKASTIKGSDSIDNKKITHKTSKKRGGGNKK